MRTLELRVITPEKTLVLPGIRSIILDCPDGKRGVLPGHTRALFEVAIGVLQCVDDTGEEKYFALAGGIAEVTPQSVVITTGSVEEAREIDVGRAKEALERAEARLR
ncbi:MAG: F0F1 ATP synthase subunit epsilon, partial [Candidatus Caldatribacteriaceae bacterium]